MQLYYQLIEQLDLAATQLNIDGSNYARFALILTDNAIELMLQKEASTIVLMDESGGWIRPPKYSQKARKDAVNGNFHAKNDFCLLAKIINGPEHEFIRVAHQVRNELYHSGVKHKDICRALAWHYHELACHLLPRLGVHIYSWGSFDELSDVVKRYTTDSGLEFRDPEQSLRSAARKLSSAKTKKADVLPSTLSHSLIQELETTDESLRFLAKENFGGLNKAQMIFELQFYDYLRGTELSKIKSPSDWKNHRTKYKNNWKPKYKRNPIPNWTRRAHKIANLENNSQALSKFARIRSDARFLSGLIREAASALDGEIQLQLDMYRGK